MNGNLSYGSSRGKSAGDASLGIYAKTEAATSKPPLTKAIIDSDTGEILLFDLVETKERDGYELIAHTTPQLARARRYALKSVVNKILPSSRTAKCMRWRLPSHQVTVMRSTEYKKAFYKGLQVCGSVWHCPVCAAKITEVRRNELVKAVELAKDKGIGVSLMTLTIPHGMGDNLIGMLNMMQKAWRKMTTERRGKAIKKSLDIVGTVRALEVTHGENGWHPHFHVLVFSGKNAAIKDIEEAYSNLWHDVCVKVGLPPPSLVYGVKVEDGSYAARYASKWGIESEITKGHLKTGKNGGMTPFDLLRDCLETKSQRSRILFLEYAEAFKGRRQLYWSNGLRSLLELQEHELSDEDIVNSYEENANVLSQLTDDEWRAILKTRSESAVLDMAENHPERLQDLISSLVCLASTIPQKVNMKKSE